MAVQAIQVSDSIVSGLEYRFASNCLRVVLESSVYTGVGINTHHESLYNHSLVSPARAALPLLRLLWVLSHVVRLYLLYIDRAPTDNTAFSSFK